MLGTSSSTTPTTTVTPSTSTLAFFPKPPKLSNLSLLEVFFSQLEDYFADTSLTDNDTKVAIFKMGLAPAEYK